MGFIGCQWKVLGSVSDLGKGRASTGGPTFLLYMVMARSTSSQAVNIGKRPQLMAVCTARVGGWGELQSRRKIALWSFSKGFCAFLGKEGRQTVHDQPV